MVALDLPVTLVNREYAEYFFSFTPFSSSTEQGDVIGIPPGNQYCKEQQLSRSQLEQWDDSILDLCLRGVGAIWDKKRNDNHFKKCSHSMN